MHRTVAIAEVKPLAICAIFKDEAPFVLEWIAYHRAVGFDHFVLYDNGSTDGGTERIRASSLADVATVIHWPQRPGQLAAYRHFIGNFATAFEWAAFIDLDEFLLPLSGTDIAELLRLRSDFSAILVHWRVFGPSGWEQPPDGLVIENYTLRSVDEMPVNRHVKSIARCADLLDVTQNPHEFRLRGPVCDTLGRTVRNIAIQPTACHEILVLNHYITRSRHDWMVKLARGSAVFNNPGPKYDEDRFEHFAEICRIEDDAIAAFAPNVRALLAGVPGSIQYNDDVRANAMLPDPTNPDGQQPSTGLNVSSRLIQLDAGLFGLSLMPGPHEAGSGLPGVRVCLPPGPSAGTEAASIMTPRRDGWLSGADEATLIRVAAGGAQILVTTYWSDAHGATSAPPLRLKRLDPEQAPMAGPAANWPGAVPGSSRVDAAEILAHIQDVGDVGGSLGDWIGNRGGGRWIEGFSVTPKQGLSSVEVEYRAVLGRDHRSPWLAGGTFCGSRGLALPLRGFCLRLRGAARATHDVICSARFVDGSEIGRASAEQVCAAATLAPLEALRIVLRPRFP
jgi:hypothetical protein